VRAISPPFAAEYTASPVEPTRPASDEIINDLAVLLRDHLAQHCVRTGDGTLRLIREDLVQNSGVVSTKRIGLSSPRS